MTDLAPCKYTTSLGRAPGLHGPNRCTVSQELGQTSHDSFPAFLRWNHQAHTSWKFAPIVPMRALVRWGERAPEDALIGGVLDNLPNTGAVAVTRQGGSLFRTWDRRRKVGASFTTAVEMRLGICGIPTGCDRVQLIGSAKTAAGPLRKRGERMGSRVEEKRERRTRCRSSNSPRLG